MREKHLIPNIDGYSNSGDGYALNAYTSSGNVVSEPIFVAGWRGWSASLICPSTGSPEGSVKVQFTNDRERGYSRSDNRLVNWTDLEDPQLPQALSGQSQIDLSHSFEDGMTYRWMRIVYTRSSGSITMTLQVQLKG